MTKTACLIALVTVTALLAACQRGPDISFEGRSVSLHAASQPTATVTSNGSFSVGTKAINVTPTQRHLLLRYYNEVTAIHAGAEAVKNAGMKMAGEGLHMAGQSIKQAVGLAHADSAQTKATGKAMQAEGQQLGKRAKGLCQQVKQVTALQATLGKSLPSFQPYADIDPAPNVNC